MNYDIRKQLEELQKYYYIAIDEAFKAKTVLGETIFEEMRQDLFDRYKIERDQLKEKAKILDKNIKFETNLKIYELTPHRCGFLWILKNEARKLKEREVAVDDRIELDTRTANVEMLEEKIYAEPELPEEQPKKISFLKRLFKRSSALEQLEGTLQAPAAPPAGNVQSESPANTAAPAPAPPAPPAPTSEARKRRRKKQPAEPIAEASPAPATPTAPEPQLSGQIAIDELDNK